MKNLFFLFIILNCSVSFSWNSRIRTTTSCTVQDRVNHSENISIEYEVDLGEECGDSKSGPHELRCVSGPELDLESISCFYYVEQNIEIKTAGGRTIKKLLQLQRSDDFDCAGAAPPISKDSKIYCQNYHEPIFARNYKNSRIRD